MNDFEYIKPIEFDPAWDNWIKVREELIDQMQDYFRLSLKDLLGEE